MTGSQHREVNSRVTDFGTLRRCSINLLRRPYRTALPQCSQDVTKVCANVLPDMTNITNIMVTGIRYCIPHGKSSLCLEAGFCY